MAKKHGSKEAQKPAARSAEYEGALRERAMLVRFSVGRWYGTGADEEVVGELRQKHNSTGDIGTFTKRFMSRDRLAAINQVTNEARRFHKGKTLIWNDSGARVLPAQLFFDYKKEMTAYEMRFNAAVAEFLERYPEFVKEEKKRLNGLFKERDYPSVDYLKARFRWDLAIEAIPSAEDFRIDLGAEEMQRIQHDIEQRVNAALHEAVREVYSTLFEQIEKLKGRLEDADAQVRGTLFENLKEQVMLLPKLNITNDPKLASLGDRIMKDLLAEDVGAVRDDQHVRKQVAKKADDILKSMASMIGAGAAG